MFLLPIDVMMLFRVVLEKISCRLKIRIKTLKNAEEKCITIWISI